MIVQINQYTYKVYWTHVLIDALPDRNYSGFTQCIIESSSGKQVSGRAICTLGDQYNKEIGRKLSLKNAITKTPFSRESRTLFWKAYLNRNKPPKMKNPYIQLKYPQYKLFKAAYLRALENQQAEFEYDNNDFATDYARYIVEYLDGIYKDLIKSEI